MEFVISILTSIVVGVLLYEGYAWLPKIAERLIERAVRRLPPEDQERCREEWNANLDALPNTTVKLWHALSFTFCRTADRITVDMFDAKFHDIEYSLNKLAEQHHRDLQKMRIVKMRAAKNAASRENVKTGLDNLVTSIKATEAHARPLIGQPATQRSIQDLTQALESFAHVLIAALTRAGDLMTARIETVGARIDQADNLIKTVFEKHSRINELFRKRRLSSKALVLALQNLNNELEQLRVIVEEDVIDDEDGARAKEHKHIVTAIQSALSSLSRGGSDVPRCLAPEANAHGRPE